jgi:hypothetical protein
MRAYEGEADVPRRAGRVLAVTLRLRCPEDLFVKPDLTPLSPDYHEHSYTPGIEYIAARLAAARLRPVHATLELPREQVTPDLASKLSEATRRYCASRMVQIQADIAVGRRRGIRGLLLALLSVVLLIGGSNFVGGWGAPWGEILADGMVIGGWVLCWSPLDTLLFTVPYQELDRRIYKQLATMDITVRPIDEA